MLNQKSGSRREIRKVHFKYLRLQAFHKKKEKSKSEKWKQKKGNFSKNIQGSRLARKEKIKNSPVLDTFWITRHLVQSCPPGYTLSRKPPRGDTG